MSRRMRQQRRHRKYDIVFLFVALVTIKPSNMGGDCEGVKGGDRRHSSVSIAPLSRPQTRNPLRNIDCI